MIPDPGWQTLAHVPADVLVDAVIAKKNLGTRIDDAPLVLGLGPGFTAPKDVDLVIETQRGHDLGRIISKGTALSNTSIPESVLGITSQRLVRAPGTGQFSSRVTIGARVKRDDILGEVTSPDSKTPVPVSSRIDGVVRGLIQDGFMVTKGQKIGDVDPRSNPDYCGTSSDKARALGGAVLTAILGRFNG